jgi:hypothetical protein
VMREEGYMEDDGQVVLDGHGVLLHDLGHHANRRHL